MRIAVSGSHRTGKTTLVEALHRALPAHVTVDEPYWLLAEEGHDFSGAPSLEDFELQLERAIELIAESDDDTVFDRCPADILAYLRTHRDAEVFDTDMWVPRIQVAMERLDLVVYVPIEESDRIAIADDEEAGLRARVDEELREVFLGDAFGSGLEILEVMGTPSERVRQVLKRVMG